MLFMIFFFSLFSFLFFGGYKGAPPPYSTFLSFPKSLIGNPKVFTEEDAFSSSVSSLSFAFFAFFFGLKDCGPLIEPFRGDGHGGFYPCYL